MLKNRLLLSTVLSVLLCSSLILCAKAEAVMWFQTYGGPAIDYAYSLVATSDGGYALAGGTYYWDGFNNPDFLLVKTNGYGDAPVIPEASWVILPLLLVATLAIFISKKKLLNQRNEKGK